MYKFSNHECVSTVYLKNGLSNKIGQYHVIFFFHILRHTYSGYETLDSFFSSTFSDIILYTIV
jgi:hypothetical protein